MNKKILATGTAILCVFICAAQTDWSLKTNKEGIEVYTKTIEGERIKGIKVKCSLHATLSQLVALLLDVNTGTEWVYQTKSSVLLKQVSPSELFYYSEVKLPWPFSNRDYIAHLIASQDAATRRVTIKAPIAPDYIPIKKNIVRVTNSYGVWLIDPAPGNTLKIDYTLQLDPGGSIPAWLVNMFIANGPVETFRRLKKQIQKPVYVNAHLPFIKD